MSPRATDTIVVLACLASLWPVFLPAADEPSPVVVSHLAGNLHQLRCFDNAAIIASVGEDGTLLVDTGYAGSAQAVMGALGDLGGGAPRIIVNTHGDMDHVGGNATLGQDAVVIAHPFVRQSMSTFFALPAIEVSGLPTVTVDGVTTIHFNGEAIRLIPVPGGHNAGDLVVHFTEHRIACIGDLVLVGSFPNADPGRGGDARRLSEILISLKSLLPADTTLFAAHGGAITMAELEAYIEMVEQTMAAVAAEIDANRSLPEIVELNPLAPWAQWEKAEVGLSFESWITEVYASLTGATVQSICAPVTETLESQGIDAALARYRQLKRDEPENWRFQRWQLNILGYQLLARERYEDAIAIFVLNIEFFPEHFDPYDSLGEAYMRAGRSVEAVANYRRSLELNPENTNAVKMLDRLRAGVTPPTG